MKRADVLLEINIISAENTLPGNVGTRIKQALDARGINVIGNTSATAIDAGRVVLPDSRSVEADLIVVATGTAAAAWPRAAGLKTDERGFILTNDYLQSVSHPNVFAAGDCATMENHPRPKSGVYAVRAGPPLAANLRRALDGEIPGPTCVPSVVSSLVPLLVPLLVPYKPQDNSLYLISLGNKSAIGSWNGISWEGLWVWRWKNLIDRRFIAKYVDKTAPNAVKP